MYKTKNGPVDLKHAKEIAAGGEGRILEHPSSKNKVVKIYHTARPAGFAKHLEALATLPKEFIKPIDIYYDSIGNVAGFDMAYVKLSDYWLFNNLFNKGFCNTNNIDNAFKVKVLEQLKESLIELHGLGLVVGDLNQYNLFFGKKGDLLFADVDSFQSQYNKHSGVLLDDIRDWTTPQINVSTDTYAFDILAFWASSFVHPFKWVAPGNNETMEQRVRNNKSILSSIAGIKIPPLYVAPTGYLLDQFKQVFGGRRFFIDFKGAVASVSTVIKQQVSSSSMNIREIMTEVLQVYASDRYITVKDKKGWNLIETMTLGVTRNTYHTDDADLIAVYPCMDGWGAMSKNNQVILPDGKKLDFRDASFYYHNGSLAVLDYGTDVLYNFQLMAGKVVGINYSTIPVFAKSIIFRTVPIQNFGSAQYLNIAFDRSYKMVNTGKGIKDAFYCNDYYAGEFKLKTKTVYKIRNASSQKAHEISLDYMPHFAVKTVKMDRLLYDLIFVPNNGCIDVYKDFQLIQSMAVSNCTQDSQLYVTNAGILMLENKTLYLLNTKQ